MKKWKIYTETEVKFKKMFYTSVGLQKPINYHSIQSLDRCITRLKLGKTMLPASSGCLIKKIDENCTICLTPFTAEHWILSCPVYQTERESLKNTLTGLGGSVVVARFAVPEGGCRTLCLQSPGDLHLGLRDGGRHLNPDMRRFLGRRCLEMILFLVLSLLLALRKFDFVSPHAVLHSLLPPVFYNSDKHFNLIILCYGSTW